MQRQHVISSVVALLAIMTGFGLSGYFFRGGDVSGSDLIKTNTPTLASLSGIGKLTYRDSLPPKAGKAVIIDLDKSDVTLYEKGLIKDVFKLVSAGAPGSVWETPAGRYKILKKEALHYSPLSHFNYPHSLQIFGNSFIHGDPYRITPGDSNVSSFGSLRMLTPDAKKVYNFLNIDDIVIVKSKREASFLSVERLASIGAILPAYASVPKSAIKLHSLGLYVADLDTGEVIMSRDENKMRAIASISKLFTALVATEDYPQNSVVEATQRSLDTLGVEGKLVAGERMALSDALYPLLLESSNDMAEVIAESFGRDQFISKMNEKSKSLHLVQTSFHDPSGLSGRNVSSPKDLFKLAQYLYKFRPDVLQITRTLSRRLQNYEGAVRHIWVNHNKFVVAKDERYLGGKTGYISESGLTSVSLFSLPLAEFSKRNIAIVLLNSANRDRDNKLILNELYNALVYDKGVTLRTVGKIPVEPRFAAEETKDRSSLMFVGNIALNTQSGDLMNYFANSGFLKESNVGVVSVVGPISDVGYQLNSGPSFHTPAAFAKILHDVGVTVAAFANTHAGDWGRTAIGDTVTIVAASAVTPIGIGRDSREAGALRVQAVNGMTLGFLNIAIAAPAWLSSPPNVPIINVLDQNDTSGFLNTVRDAANQVQFLTVVYTANEGASIINIDEARTFAHALVDSGAKIVIGVGPHVTGPIERYKGAVIAYSLGDFIYDPAYLTKPFQGIALEVLLQQGEIVETNGAIVRQDEKGIPYLSEDDL